MKEDDIETLATILENAQNKNPIKRDGFTTLHAAASVGLKSGYKIIMDLVDDKKEKQKEQL